MPITCASLTTMYLPSRPDKAEHTMKHRRLSRQAPYLLASVCRKCRVIRMILLSSHDARASFLAVSFLLLSLLVSAGPPDLSGPKIPRAELHAIRPQSVPVTVDGGTTELTLSGKYFTEEFGLGVLRCRFHFPGQTPLIVLAARSTGGCRVSHDQDYQFCASTQARCALPNMKSAARVAVQITNDFGLLNHTKTDGTAPFLYDGGEGRWSTEKVYFTFVPRLQKISVDQVPIGVSQNISIFGQGLRAVGNKTMACVFVNLGIHNLFIPSTMTVFNRHRPWSFQESMKQNRTSPYFEVSLAQWHTDEHISCVLHAGESYLARELVVTVSIDFCDAQTAGTTALDLCNHLSPFNRNVTIHVIPIVSDISPPSGPVSESTTLTISGSGFPLVSHHYIRTSAAPGKKIEGAFEIFAQIFEDNFESEDWSSVEMDLETHPTLSGYNVQKKWKKGPITGSKYIPFISLTTKKIIPRLGGYRGRRTNFSRPGSGGEGSLMLKKTENYNFESQASCDGYWHSVEEKHILPSQLSFWVFGDASNLGSSGFISINSGDENTCGQWNETLFELGANDTRWMYRQPDNSTYKEFSVVKKLPNYWHHVILDFRWTERKLRLAIDGHAANEDLPFVCGSQCGNVSGTMSGGETFGFRTIFLYNKDVQTTSVWDDFSIVVGPGYPIPFNANARLLEGAVTRVPHYFLHGIPALKGKVLTRGATKGAKILFIGEPIISSRLEALQLHIFLKNNISNALKSKSESLKIIVCSRAGAVFVVEQVHNVTLILPNITQTEKNLHRMLLHPPVYVPHSVKEQFVGLVYQGGHSQDILEFYETNETTPGVYFTSWIDPEASLKKGQQLSTLQYSKDGVPGFAVEGVAGGMGISRAKIVRCEEKSADEGYDWMIETTHKSNQAMWQLMSSFRVKKQFLRPQSRADVTIRGGARCRFKHSTLDPIVVDALQKSANSIVCSTPVMRQPFSNIEVSISFDGGKFYSSRRVNVTEFHTFPTVSNILPSSGSFKGGDIVDIFGSGFLNTSTVMCKFGNKSVYAHSFINDTHIQCRSPSVHADMLPSSLDDIVKVIVEVSNDGVRFSVARQIRELGRYPLGNIFSYRIIPIIDYIYPRFVSQKGGSHINVYGHFFADMSSLRCNFFSDSSVSNVALHKDAKSSSTFYNVCNLDQTGWPVDCGKVGNIATVSEDIFQVKGNKVAESEWPFEYRARSPRYAVDGNTNMFGEQYASLTTPEASPWWQVDLGENHTLDYINVYLGLGTKRINLEDPPYVLLGSDEDFPVDKNTSTFASDIDHSTRTCGKSCWSGLNLTGNQTGEYTWRHIGVNARYIRVRLKPKFNTWYAEKCKQWYFRNDTNGTTTKHVRQTINRLMVKGDLNCKPYNASVASCRFVHMETSNSTDSSMLGESLLPICIVFNCTNVTTAINTECTVDFEKEEILMQLSLAEVQVYGQALKYDVAKTTSLVLPYYVSENHITCVTPPQKIQARDVIVSVNVFNRYSRHLEGSNRKRIIFKAPVRIRRLSHRKSHIWGNLPIVVYGENFVNTSDTNYDFSRTVSGQYASGGRLGFRHLLKCRFGDVSVHATYINRSAISCIAPTVKVSKVVDVEVSINGVDFTQSNTKFFYYGNCPAGSYCPDHETQFTSGQNIPCPAGSSCAYPGMYLPTPCSPGYFQHDASQVKCAICPVGYECPGYGMTRPKLCRLGHVCDKEGIILSDTPCPPGHYCQYGTKTAITCFDTIKSRVYPNGFNIQFPFGDCENTTAKGQQLHRLQLEDYKFKESGKETTFMPQVCPRNSYCGPGVKTGIQMLCSKRTAPECYTTPQPCLSGYVCTNGSETPKGTYDCPVGYFCPDGSQHTCKTFIEKVYDPNNKLDIDYSKISGIKFLLALNTCPCPPGASCGKKNLREPVQCNPGFYSDDFQLASCKPCPIGFTCPGLKMTKPVPCLPGWVCDEEGLSNEKTQCIEGHYCLEGTATQTGFALQKLDFLSDLVIVEENFYRTSYGNVSVNYAPQLLQNVPAFRNRYVGKLESGFAYPRNATQFSATESFRLKNIFKEQYDHTNRANIIGISVDENLTESTGFSDPEFYFRSSVDNEPVDLFFEFLEPLPLDRIVVYPMLPMMEKNIKLEDLRTNYTVEVLKKHRTKHGLISEWESIESKGGYENRVEIRWDRDNACRDFPRGCMSNEHIVQRQIPYVVHALCALENEYDSCNSSANKPSEYYKRLKLKNYPNREELEYFLSIPFTTEGLRFNQTVLPGEPEDLDSFQWFNKDLELVEKIRIKLYPSSSRTNVEDNGIVALSAIEIIIRNETKFRPWACGSKLYCLSGVAKREMGEQNFDAPQPCKPGSYCKRGCPRSQGSGPCPSGQFCEKGTSEPMDAAEGQFAESLGNIKGNKCFSGFFGPVRGLDRCYPCPKGFFCPATTSTCWTRNKTVSQNVNHNGFFAKDISDDGTSIACSETNAMDLTIQNVLIGPPYNKTSGGAARGSKAGEVGRNDTIICSAGFVCSQEELSSVTEGCPTGHYCLEGTMTSDTTSSCDRESHCTNKLAIGRVAPERLDLTKGIENGTSYSTSHTTVSVTFQTHGNGDPTISGIKHLFDSNYPFICPSYVHKDVPPTETTPRYRGKYHGCYSYDGIVKRGVADVQVQIFIDLNSRSPAGDPTNNRYNGKNPSFKNYYKPVAGILRRADNEELLYYCSLDTPDNLPAAYESVGACPQIDEIEEAVRRSVELQISTMANKNISVWQAYADEAYFGSTGKTLLDRQLRAAITLETSYEGMEQMKKYFTDTNETTADISITLKDVSKKTSFDRPYILKFEKRIRVFASRGFWGATHENQRSNPYFTRYTEELTLSQLENPENVLRYSGMWRSLIDFVDNPQRTQDSIYSVEDYCKFKPEFPGFLSVNSKSELSGKENCILYWKNQGYDGKWRMKETEVFISVVLPTPRTLIISSRASEGAVLSGHFYLHRDLYSASTDKDGGIVSPMVNYNAEPEEMEATLRLLGVKGVLNVTRSTLGHFEIGGYTWIINSTEDLSGFQASKEKPIVWPRQEWPRGYFESGNPGFERTLIAFPEILRSEKFPEKLWINDGRRWQVHSAWNSYGTLINNVRVGDIVSLKFSFKNKVHLDSVRIYPYALMRCDQIECKDTEEPWKSTFYNVDYRIDAKIGSIGNESNATWVTVTRNATGEIGFVESFRKEGLNASAELIFFDYSIPRLRNLPEFLNESNIHREYVNGSWWFDLPLQQTFELRVHFRHPAKSNIDRKQFSNRFMLLNEIELLSRDEQYVPGTIVAAQKSKHGNTSFQTCCRGPIKCPPGSYCLSGASHPYTFTPEEQQAYNDGQDFEAPQAGIAGAYYLEGTGDPQGSGRCPPGFYCPVMTHVPRPCWQGHYCKGFGTVAPTACPVGRFSRIGIPPYIYGWEDSWELSKEASRLMELNQYIKYPQAMIKTLSAPNRLVERFWESKTTSLTDFPQRSFKLMDGNGGGFSNGKRAVLLKNGVPIHKNYSLTVHKNGGCVLPLVAELSNNHRVINGVKNIEGRMAIVMQDKNVSFQQCKPSANNVSFSAEIWTSIDNISFHGASMDLVSTRHDENKTGWSLSVSKFVESYTFWCYTPTDHVGRRIYFHFASKSLLLFSNQTVAELKSALLGLPEILEVRINGIELSTQLCSAGSGQGQNTTIYITRLNESIVDANDPCTSKQECRRSLRGKTSLLLSRKEKRINFGLDFNRFYFSNNNGNFSLSDDNPDANGFKYLHLIPNVYLRWEFWIGNGQEFKIITGHRLSPHNDQTGLPRDQLGRTWTHVVATYDDEQKKGRLIIDNSDFIDLLYVGQDYEMGIENISFIPGKSDITMVSIPGVHIEDPVIFPTSLTEQHIKDHYYAVFDATVGMEECRVCAGGTSCLQDGMIIPTPCRPGAFRNQGAPLPSCSNCPEGYYSFVEAIRHSEECKLCPEGLVCKVEGMNNLTYTKCTDADGLIIPCQAELCPNTAVCGEGTKKSTMLKVPCPAGFKCDKGTCPDGRRVYEVIMPELPPPVSNKPLLNWLLTAPVRNTKATILRNFTWIPCDESNFCDQGTNIESASVCPEGNYCPTGTALYCCQPHCEQIRCRPSMLTGKEQRDEELRRSYAWSLNFPSPLVLNQLCPKGTSSLRSAKHKLDCFLDWKESDLNGPALYVNPLKPHPYTIFSSDKRKQTWGTWSNCSSNPENMYYSSESLPRITIPPMSSVDILFNFTNVPQEFRYNDHFRISIFIGSNRISDRLLMPESFSRMFPNERIVAGSASATAVTTATLERPRPYVDVLFDNADRRIVKIDLRNALDRKLEGYMTLIYKSKATKISAQSDANEMNVALGRLGVKTQSVVRESHRRNDDHAGYTWTIIFLNEQDRNIQIGSPGLRQRLLTISLSGLSAKRIFKMHTFLAQPTSMSISIEVMHENFPTEFLKCSRFADIFFNTSFINIHRPSRAFLRFDRLFSAVVSREDTDGMSLPVNLPQNNTDCPCVNWTKSGCSSAADRKLCEMIPLYSTFSYIMPSDIGTLMPDPLSRVLASHEIAAYWAFTKFSAEGVSRGELEGPNMWQQEKAVTIAKREPLISKSEFAMADKAIRYERHASYITMTHLPYISNCREIPSSAPLFRLFEDGDRCTLYDFDKTVPVRSSDMSFGRAKLHSDSCDYNIRCIYDEIEEDTAFPYTASVPESKSIFWFHLTPEKQKTPFSLTFDALIPPLLADGTSHSSERLYERWRGKKELIPVEVFRNPVYYGLPEKYIPRNITFTVKYWQRSKSRKQLMAAELYFDNFYRPDFCGGTATNRYYEDCACGVVETEFNQSKVNDYRAQCTRAEKKGYYLNIVYQPLGWFELYDKLVFPSYIYLASFWVVCIAFLVLYGVLVFVDYCRAFHRKMRFPLASFILRSTNPMIAAYVSHAIPIGVYFLLVSYLLDPSRLYLLRDFPGKIEALFECFPPFSQPGSIKCRSVLKNDKHKIIVNNERMMMCIALIAWYLLTRGIRLMCPAECELNALKFQEWIYDKKNRKRLSVKGKDAKTVERINDEIARKRRELMPNGGKLDPYAALYLKRNHLSMYVYGHVFFFVGVLAFCQSSTYYQSIPIIAIVLKVAKFYWAHIMRSALREDMLTIPLLSTYGIVEILAALCSRSLAVYSLLCLAQILAESLRRIYFDPGYYYIQSRTLSPDTIRLLGREKFESILNGMVETNEDKALQKEYRRIIGKENAIRDLNASCVMVLPHVFMPFLLCIFYIFYTPLDFFVRYKILYESLPLYIFVSIMITVVAVLADYCVSFVLDARFSARRRLSYLSMLHPHGMVFMENPEDVIKPDLRIDSSLRTADQYGFTIQYYYAICVLVSSMVCAFLFISIMFQDHYNGFETRGYFDKVLDGFGWFIAFILYTIGKMIFSKFSNKVFSTLCDLRSSMEEKDLNAELQNEIKRVCAAALQENWPEGELVTRIEQTVNDIVAARFESARAKQKLPGAKSSDLSSAVLKAVEGDVTQSTHEAGDAQTSAQQLTVPPDVLALMTLAGSKTNTNIDFPVEMLSSRERSKVRFHGRVD